MNIEDYFSHEDIEPGDMNIIPKELVKKMSDKDINEITAGIFPDVKAIRERAHARLKGSRLEVATNAVFSKPRGLPLKIVSPAVFDMLTMLDVDPTEMPVADSQSLMIMLWAYIQEYEALKKKEGIREK